MSEREEDSGRFALTSREEEFPYPMVPTRREEELLGRCVSYEQYRELEDLCQTLLLRFNELIDHLVANGVTVRLSEKKVTVE